MNPKWSSAVRGYYARSGLAWTQTISSVSTPMEYGQSNVGGELILSRRFGEWASPYLSVGYSSNSGELKSLGASSVFASGFTSGLTAQDRISGFNFALGFEASLAMMRLGLEVGSSYRVLVSGFKVSAAF
jgi:hypothetical protein